jgi:NAD+ synthase
METSRRMNRADLKVNTDLVRDLLVRFIHDETTSAGFSKAVLGVSGGVDSAVSAALAAKALGGENVLGVMMPYRTSSANSLTDAKLLNYQNGRCILR